METCLAVAFGILLVSCAFLCTCLAIFCVERRNERKNMNAFEKWRSKNAAMGRSRKADARVWKAALEWVLNNNEIVTDQLDFIKEELKERNER